MSSKFNNKSLTIILVILIGLFAFYQFYRKARIEKTIKTELVSFDTTKITKILLYPMAEKRAEITFTKDGKFWKVNKDKVTCDAEPNAIKSLITQLLSIKSQRLASRSKEKWAEYLLTDSTSTRVKVYENNKLKTDILFGKFTYKQDRSQYGGVSGTSFVRLKGEDEIYAVDGFVVFSFNQEFKNWRNQTLVRLNKQDVTKLTFSYPGDSSFVAELKDKKWYSGPSLLDSTKVADYLGSLAYKNSSNFDDTFNPIGSSDCRLIIEGNNMKTITVQAFMYKPGEFIINSSLNEKSNFISNYAGTYNEIFKTVKNFVPDMQGVKKKKK
jgi:hypothetical protein